jgi:hypothetical protein
MSFTLTSIREDDTFTVQAQTMKAVGPGASQVLTINNVTTYVQNGCFVFQTKGSHPVCISQGGSKNYLTAKSICVLKARPSSLMIDGAECIDLWKNECIELWKNAIQN